ncbi:hypothetical protein HaLaN_09371 [Haematococcus lacustris]|uniref:Uncharacterized protein n=1 Tax=Haematococcus lacustris TaxID=44745 RepID=A0A699Z1U7_HAELA|nr:hypothetical protein HaLaN_09371 [Haematococcus lacustris]
MVLGGAGAYADSGPSLHLTCGGELQVQVFNVKRLGWEPVLEPWAWQARYTADLSTPLGANGAQTQLTGHRMALSAPGIMDFTAAPSLVAAATQLSHLASYLGDGQGMMVVAVEQQAPGSHDQNEPNLHVATSATAGGVGGAPPLATCWLRNELGMVVEYCVADYIGPFRVAMPGSSTPLAVIDVDSCALEGTLVTPANAAAMPAKLPVVVAGAPAAGLHLPSNVRLSRTAASAVEAATAAVCTLHRRAAMQQPNLHVATSATAGGVGGAPPLATCWLRNELGMVVEYCVADYIGPFRVAMPGSSTPLAVIDVDSCALE